MKRKTKRIPKSSFPDIERSVAIFIWPMTKFFFRRPVSTPTSELMKIARAIAKQHGLRLSGLEFGVKRNPGVYADLIIYITQKGDGWMKKLLETS
jgi:hypothetical protein